MSLNDSPVVLHQGVYKKIASVSDAVFMITGMTIGAGVLGIPYVVAQVGLGVGLLYILVLGAVMLFLNLMIGEIAVRTDGNLQLPGFAGKYLGRWAKDLLSLTIVLSSAGALLAYVVGEGEILSALFGGNPVMWSVVFWSVASLVVWRGLQSAKRVTKILSFAVIAIIVGLSLFLTPHVNLNYFFEFHAASLFLPYGVILFALHASPAIAEAHALLPGSQKHFRKALIIGTLIPIAVYILFAFAVVGVMGLNTTEVATIGLGSRFGQIILVIANVFAALAMTTGYIGLGIALKQSLVWDHKIKPFIATLFVLALPITLFTLGVRSFVAILDTVGGLFIGIEAILMVLVYWKAKQKGDLDASRYKFDFLWLLAVPVLLIFSGVTVVSIAKLFGWY